MPANAPLLKGNTSDYFGGSHMATSVKIDDELKSRIHRLAETRQRTAHWIMREAIRDYVEREEAREISCIT